MVCLPVTSRHVAPRRATPRHAASGRAASRPASVFSVFFFCRRTDAPQAQNLVMYHMPLRHATSTSRPVPSRPAPDLSSVFLLQANGRPSGAKPGDASGGRPHHASGALQPFQDGADRAQDFGREVTKKNCSSGSWLNMCCCCFVPVYVSPQNKTIRPDAFRAQPRPFPVSPTLLETCSLLLGVYFIFVYLVVLFFLCKGAHTQH